MFAKSAYNMKRIKIIIMIVSVILLLIISNVMMYYIKWKPKIEDIMMGYEQEIELLNKTLDEIGPLQEVYTLRSDIEPGREIEEEDLETRRAPISFLTENYVLDPSEVVGRYYKVALTEGSPMLLDLAMDEEIDVFKTTREIDIVASVLPLGLAVGDYIDLRLTYPMGEDFIVLSHKRVSAINTEAVTISLKEDEIHLYQAALVDYILHKDKGAMLYMTEYIEPGVQDPSVVYYRVPDYILAVMKGDPNIDNPDKVDDEQNKEEREQLLDAATEKVTIEMAEIILAGRLEVLAKLFEGKEIKVKEEIKEKEMEQERRLEEERAKDEYSIEEETIQEAEDQLTIGEGVVD